MKESADDFCFFGDEDIFLIDFDPQIKGSIARDEVIRESLKNLETRKSNFESTLLNLREHLIELQNLKNNEDQSFNSISKTLEKILTKRKAIVVKLAEAEKTAIEAGKALVEFTTQKNLIEKVASSVPWLSSHRTTAFR